MKQIIQDLKNGETILEEVPVPQVKAGYVLIKTSRSLVSLGTERMLVEFGKANLIDKARQQPDKVKQVLDIAYKYLFIMAIFLWVLYLLYVYRSAIQGLGNTLIPLASGVVEFCMRVGVALLLPKLIGEDGIFYAEISAWSGAAILLIVSYVVIIRKYKE